MEMDGEDEAPGYFKLFNEGSQNYLLHSSEDGLNDNFPVESIFTDWSTEGFPILLSGPLIADANNDSESTSTNIQLFNEENDNSTLNGDLGDDNAVTFFSNDVLLRVEGDNEDPKKTVTHVINGDTYSITYSQEDEEQESTENGGANLEIIQLVNIDGTVTSINKNLWGAVDERTKPINFEGFYSEVKALKCKLCSFLCESVEEIQSHIGSSHAKELTDLDNAENCSVGRGGIVGTQMTSILNRGNNQTKYTLFLCSDCGSGYSCKEDLKEHMISQHKMVYATTPQSPKPLPQEEKPPPADPKQTLKAFTVNLFKKQKSMRNAKCSVKGCPLRFDKDESRKRHESCHVNGQKRQFMCPVCDQKFSLWRVCNMHLWKFHQIDLGLYTCPMCNQFKSNSPMRVMNHMNIHREEKPFLCGLCNKGFKQLNQLRNHDVCHKAKTEGSESLAQKQCEICDRLLANAKCLKKHMKYVHDKFKPFICNICGHQAARKEMLQVHYRQHTGDKPFKCNYCEYKTGDKNCLRKHTMRHFGTAKYSCPYCNYQAIQTSNYKAHLINKHPGKEGTYACTLCRYTTVNCRSYMSHVKCHELEANKSNGNVDKAVEDTESKSSDETHNFLNTDHSEEAVDIGGITIPATFDLSLVTENQTSLI